jgi:methyl-accepting chemotaxis protein
MMALIKKSLPAAAFVTAEAGKPSSASTRDAEAQRKKARTLAKQQQAAERVAAATGQLSSGINEAAAAAEQLKRNAEQIATGAEEASGAAQESLAAFKQVEGAIARQMQNADVSQSKVEATQSLVVKTSVAKWQPWCRTCVVAADRQNTSVKMVAELEKQAASIGDIVKAVARIADQTNLLALNAAIEAARAGSTARVSRWSPTKCGRWPRPRRRAPSRFRIWSGRFSRK